MATPNSSSITLQMQNEDRISALPDHLLWKILSFLTVKEAATCSILSTRWSYIFASLPDISLIFKSPEETKQELSQISKFLSFGNRLFRVRNKAPIRKFNLSIIYIFNPPDDYYQTIESWVCAALSCNVQELTLWSGSGVIREHTIRSSIFTCKTLVSLELRYMKLNDVLFKGICLPLLKVLHLENIDFNNDEDWLSAIIQGCPLLQELDLNVYSRNDMNEQLSRSGIFRYKRLVVFRLDLDRRMPAALCPDSVCLPNLKVLYIRRFKLSPDKGDDALQCFINSCPVLEELHLYALCFPDYPNGILRIQSSSLKFLSLCPYDHGRVASYNIIIESTSLECLVYNGEGETNRLIVNAPNLRHFDYTGDLERVLFPLGLRLHFSASISVEDSYQDRTEHDSPRVEQALDLVTNLQDAKSLWLSETTLEALYHCADPLPTFNNLTNLKLDYRQRMSDGSSVKGKRWWKMLPRLFASAPKLEVLLIGKVFLETWIPDGEFKEFERLLTVNLPVHIIERLREITIEAFDDPQDNEIFAIEYILQNGKALKRFTIGALRQQSNLPPEYCNKILSLKKCSKDCLIVFQHCYYPGESFHLARSRLESEGVKTLFPC